MYNHTIKHRLAILVNHINPDVQKRNKIYHNATRFFALPKSTSVNPQRMLTWLNTLKFYLNVVKSETVAKSFSSLIVSILKYERLPPSYTVFLKHFLMAVNNKQHHFSMIEILIAISIIVTFTGLTGIVFARILERTKVANAQLDLTRIQEGLVMYNTRENKYPLDIETLVEGGELNKIPKDPWGGEYIYVPHVDWNRLVRLLNTKTPRMDKLEYYIQAIKKYKNILEDLPKNVEPMTIFTVASETPFAICLGKTMPIFPPKVEISSSRDKIKQVAQLMKLALERSSSIPELHEHLTDLISQIKG